MNEKLALKLLAEDRVGGYLVVWGSASQRDLQGEYFTKDTDLGLDWYSQRPVLYHHGLDADMEATVIGAIDTLKADDVGLWAEAQLDLRKRWVSVVKKLIDQGVIGWSSGSLPHLVEVSTDGQIKRWPIVEGSLTPTPAEPRRTNVGMVKAAYKALGIPTEQLQLPEENNAGNSLPAANALKSAGGAESTRGNTYQKTLDEKGTVMNREAMIKSLAECFGVEAKLDAVKSALEAMIKMVAGEMPAEEEANKAEVDMQALAMALGLEAGSDPAMLVERLRAILAQLEAPPAKSYNFNALKSAADMVAMNAPAANDPLPHKTSERKNMEVANYNKGVPVPGVAQLLRSIVERKSETAIKSLGYSIGPTGGYMLRRETANEIIEKFYAASVVKELGCTVVPMNGIETLDYTKQLTGASAYYRGAGQTATQSNLTLGKVTLNLKELVAATKINQRLLLNSDDRLEGMIREDLEKSLGLRADLAALRGAGGIPDSGSSGSEPRGLRYTTGVTVTELGAGNGENPTIDDFVNGWGRIEDENVPSSDKWGIAFSPRTKRHMENMRDTTGQLISDSKWAGGHKYKTTTQISNALTVGSSTDCSEIYLGAWEYLIMGLGQDISFKVDQSIYVLTGEIYIEAAMMHDVAIAQPVAFEILTGVRSV